MDSIGDYLYIIILAIAGLSSLFRKKPKEEIYIPDADEPTVAPWDEMATEEEVSTEIFQPLENVKPEYNPIVSYENTIDFSKLRSKNTVTTINPTKESKSTILTEECDGISIEFNSKEDLKRAFIYSEIFTRKYGSS